MNQSSDVLPSESIINQSQKSVNQSKPLISLNSTQELTSLYITQIGEIFVGTKYWLSIYYFFKNELKAKNHISIGSRINNIDSIIFENVRHVALATSDGFINLLKIKYDDPKIAIDAHERISIYYGEANLVSLIDQNTIISAGDNSIVSIITKPDSNNKSWNHKQFQKNINITALKYFNDQIYIGYENGEVEIFTFTKGEVFMENSARILKFESQILSFYFNKIPIIVTEQTYNELDQNLNKRNTICFSIKANKVSLNVDDRDGQIKQQMIVSDSNKIEVYENNILVPSPNISPKDLISFSFFGDALIVLSSQTVSLYKL